MRVDEKSFVTWIETVLLNGYVVLIIRSPYTVSILISVPIYASPSSPYKTQLVILHSSLSTVNKDSNFTG